MKIKCVRFPCEQCGVTASIPVFYNRSGAIKYGRARHYTGQLNCKPQFSYHQQSLQYIESQLSQMAMGKAEIGHIGQNGQSVDVDLEKPELRSKLSNVAGGEGFEPSTLRTFFRKRNPCQRKAINWVWLVFHVLFLRNRLRNNTLVSDRQI
jgi:hypothetical protein